MHLVGRQLVRNQAHLFVDVVLPHALGESGELAFDVLCVLASQRRGSELLGAGAMTGGAGWDAAPGIAGEDQADRGSCCRRLRPPCGTPSPATGGSPSARWAK